MQYPTVLMIGREHTPLQTCPQLNAILSQKLESLVADDSIAFTSKNAEEITVVSPRIGATKNDSFEYPI